MSALFTTPSKIGNGLQLLGKVGPNEEDPKNKDFMTFQKSQNKLVRILSGTKTTDEISTKTLLDNPGIFSVLSVNQVNAYIKLTENRKGVHSNNGLLQINEVTKPDGAVSTRSDGIQRLIQHGSSALSCKTFKNEATHLWNAAPF